MRRQHFMKTEINYKEYNNEKRETEGKSKAALRHHSQSTDY